MLGILLDLNPQLDGVSWFYWGRLRGGFFLALLLLASPLSCDQGEQKSDETSIRLAISSVVDVGSVRVRMRTNDLTLTDDLTLDTRDRDLTTDPYVIKLRPSTLFGKEFFVYAQGALAEDPRHLTAESTFLTFQSGQEQDVELILREGFTDEDDDGFEQCTGRPDCDCDDKPGQGSRINPYLEESCDDPYDNNCSGVANEGCACTGDTSCTALPPNLWAFAGVGRCKLGMLDCVQGKYALDCRDAGAPIDEVPGNYIDDDCDGNVDEGSSCSAGTERPCFLGTVDDPHNPISNLQTQASDLALGECRTGRQLCDIYGVWGECKGETRPQRPLFVQREVGGEVTLVESVGWTEVQIPDHIDQCDGLDNDCDGATDEEAVFDQDGDGYTYCGTCPGASLPRLCDEFIDCDDSTALVNPGVGELCGNTVDEDCFCDHGDGLGGPRLTVSGEENCSPLEAALDCGVLPRSDQNPVGECRDSPLPYYYGYSGETVTDQDCYYCGLSYGGACDAATSSCQTRDARCSDCPFKGTLASERPFCAVSGGGCRDVEPPLWYPLIGDDPNDECGAVSCSGYYFGVVDNRCYERQGFSDADVHCNGLQGCETSADVCPGQGLRESTFIAPPSICKKVGSGCAGQVAPLWVDQINNEDLFDECITAYTCDGSDGKSVHYFGTLDPSLNDGVDNPVCYIRANVPGNACNGRGACQNQNLACSFSGSGEPVDGEHRRPACNRPATSVEDATSCWGTTPPVYKPVTPGEDPYSDCEDIPCCLSYSGEGACCLKAGELCRQDSECHSGQCRMNWNSTTGYCVESESACVYARAEVVVERIEGYVECGGGDSYRVCNAGVWGPNTSCSATTCDGGCGYITDLDNRCVAGASLGVAGCEAALVGDVTCVSCSPFSARNGECHSGVSGCDKTCGAECAEGEIKNSNILYCSGAEGESKRRYDSCAVSAGVCRFQDDFETSNDVTAEACTERRIDCNAASGACWASCENDAQCHSGSHCDDGNCFTDLPAGEVCDEASDCQSGACRADWRGGTERCAENTTSCIYGVDELVHQRPEGFVECAGEDGHKTCAGGAWESPVSCDGTTCAGGCGYFTDEGNTCLSGANAQVAGCSADLTPSACIDCGSRSAVAGGCATGLAACSISCGAPCVEGETRSLDLYCTSEEGGDSYRRVDACSLRGGECAFVDDGAVNDVLNKACGFFDCDSGQGVCVTSCSADGACSEGAHCADGSCVADLESGAACEEQSDCKSGFCRTTWGGDAKFCSDDGVSCVYQKESGEVLFRESGFRDCNGTDSYRVCVDGAWGEALRCAAAVCDNGCGYVTDVQNTCSSGQGALGGCAIETGTAGEAFECVDCGGRTAVAGECSPGVDACATACSPTCIEGDTTAGDLYCQPDRDGDLYTRVNPCGVHNGVCQFIDDGTVSDSLAASCGSFDCDPGSLSCLTTCDSPDDCNSGGSCQEGGCCQSACDGVCEACFVAGGAATEGVCTDYCQRVWINEIHYDDEGDDENEGVEVAGPAGSSLEGWKLVFYRDAVGRMYKTVELGGSIDDEGAGYGAVAFGIPDLDNGSPGGVVLVDALGRVLYFLSYEGEMTGEDGVAVGMNAVLLGVSESGSNSGSSSLELRGGGNTYADFSWGEGIASSFGTLNPGQVIDE